MESAIDCTKPRDASRLSLLLRPTLERPHELATLHDLHAHVWPSELVRNILHELYRDDLQDPKDQYTEYMFPAPVLCTIVRPSVSWKGRHVVSLSSDIKRLLSSSSGFELKKKKKKMRSDRANMGKPHIHASPLRFYQDTVYQLGILRYYDRYIYPGVKDATE
jgi:hypothetical protein